MNCPVCDRSLAPTLSICPSCGAMKNDTVREELQSKLMPGRIAPPAEMKARPILPRPSEPIAEPRPALPRPATAAAANFAPRMQAPAPPPMKRTETSDLVSPKTSPTLVGFQNKNATLPDWRIQLQNAVQQRKGSSADAVSAPANVQPQFPVNGGTALKAEIVPRAEPVKSEPVISDPRVASAMRRINESRNTFLEPEKKAPAAIPVQPKPYKFDVIATNAAPQSLPARPNTLPKPVLVSSPPITIKRDTNKLPPIASISAPAVELEEPIVAKQDSGPLSGEFAEIKRIRIRAENTEINDVDQIDDLNDEIEDLAQFSTRFGAGLFDLIIGAFASMLLLSPIAFTRGDWFTTAGLLTFAGVFAIVMFLYMTICLGFFGKTMGMRLFSLELVDAVENEYPTLHQAAVSSSVFLLSLTFGGAGFLTVFYNEEKRAAHDLLSGTILVKEF